ncbi:MAG: SH3 domain-containing protein [Treponema sp.]|nr:SH3 domain-containing protein [Treponema sp.]MCL2252194.1 SH3 domain-containing protein [Treponema sp.]
MAEIDDLFYKYKNGKMDVGFRWHADSFQCEASALGEVNFIWMSRSNTEFTIQMLTDLHIPRIRWSGYNISQSGCLTYTDTQRDSVSGREVTRDYKVKFRAEFELQSDKNLHVVQFKRVPEESETTKRWVFEDYNEGMMYLTGEGFPFDFDKAKELFKEAADNDHPGAIAMLKKLRFAKAADYIPNLVKAKTGNPKAQLNLGLDYYNGTGGVAKDYAKAVEWWQKSADQGNLDSLCNLGTAYHRGLGVTQDEAKGLELYQNASDQGLGRASLLIGDLYKDGKGVPEDKKKAKENYIKAIEQGFEPAKKKFEELTGKPYQPKSTSSGSNETAFQKLGEMLGFQWWEDGVPVILAIILALVMTAGSAVLAMMFLPKWWIPIVIGVLVLSFCALRWRNPFLIVVFSIATVAGGIFYYLNPANPLQQLVTSIMSGNTLKLDIAEKQTATVTANINFRSGPSTDHSIIRQLWEGDTVSLTGKTSGGWVQVSHRDETGWISSEFLKNNSEP